MTTIPPWIILDPLINSWLLEDIGRGDRSTTGLFSGVAQVREAQWIVKEAGVIAGLPIAARVFHLLNPQVNLIPLVLEGDRCEVGQVIAKIIGPFDGLLTGERVALNLTMHLSGIATSTRKYVEKIADLPTKLVDTRKTTPGLRILEKYASTVGGAMNHRMGLDDGVMIKDNHIEAAGGIKEAIERIRQAVPYPLSMEVETANLQQVKEALDSNTDIIMLDNMTPEVMTEAVRLIRQHSNRVKIEASGNITLDNIRAVAETGIDYISTSATVTRSTWLDLSMKLTPLTVNNDQ